MPLARIMTGGQTGADRAALDVALMIGLECGGWCPRGRAAEDGPIPERYPLRDTPSDDPAQRTEWNVRDSDATLIVAAAPLTGGTALTEQVARRLGRPCLVVDPADARASATVRTWLDHHPVRMLNVAGPRERDVPGTYEQAKALLRRVLDQTGGE